MANKTPQPQRARRDVQVIRPFFASGRRMVPGEVVSLTEDAAAIKVRSHKAAYVDQNQEERSAPPGEDKRAPSGNTSTRGKGRRSK